MKALKLILQGILGSIVAIIFLGAIGYVLIVAPLSIGIAFAVILAILTAYLSTKIKLALEKKKRETNIVEKINKQKLKIGLTQFESAMVDEPPKPKKSKQTIPAVGVKGKVKKKTKKVKK
ncbi:hypothetical protein LCGC14_2290500 [marine sediment metagenome]|uniref:Uncharacterized protein n=1 Tax=marine sediment metagenome TaxID=412755 RepID=A0A0F9DDY0_9ZZZZ